MKTIGPIRKDLRLKNYDYSYSGYYFITICTQYNQCILCRGEQCSPEGTINFRLSQIGETVDIAINSIEKNYPVIRIDKYIIMPNHIHLIIVINNSRSGRVLLAPTVPTISRVVQQLKSYVTKQVGYSIWQKSFHDHIIRDEISYKEICEYIDLNPLKWKLDKYYREY